MALYSVRQTCISKRLPVLDFLAPSINVSSLQAQRHFTTTSQNHMRRDGNPRRGVSALRRSRARVSPFIEHAKLPKPEMKQHKYTESDGTEDHGLWQFFSPERDPLTTPAQDSSHGRSWTPIELRRKSWEDLHALWWICMKERNRIATSSHERTRLKAGLGYVEADKRDATVKKTMKIIKFVLLERWRAWNEARKLAMDDPTVDLSGEGAAYEASREEVFEPDLDEQATERALPEPENPPSRLENARTS